MSSDQLLRGGCSCGRNHYLIAVPSNASTTAQIFLDDSADQRRAHSSPLAAFLRIPLPWLHSTTYAFYPDETHAAIRRVFTPRHAPQTKRHFCGFCGTPLSYWSETNKEEAEWVYVSLGSLGVESMALLNDAGVLPSMDLGNVHEEKSTETTDLLKEEEGRETSGEPWFEEIIEGSTLGRLRRRRGGETSTDGKTRVEWEVVEFNGEDEHGSTESGIGTGKRKIGEFEEGEDVDMRGGY